MQERSHFSGVDVATALGVITIWGLNFVAMKYALRDFTPFQLGFWRYVFAVLPLLMWVRRPRLSWGWLALAGMTQLGQFGFLFVALQVGMTSALASVLMQTQVFFTTLFGWVFLRERLTPAMVAGLFLASLGLACFALNTLQDSGADVTMIGLLLNLAGAAMWAASNIVTRRIQMANPAFDALQFIVWMSLMPILPFAALAWFAEPEASRWHWTQAQPGAWASVAYLGWFATIAAYTLWTRLLKRYAASRVAPFSLGVPVIGLGAGHLLLGETITRWQFLGTACVVSALVVVLGMQGKSKPRSTPSAGPSGP